MDEQTPYEEVIYSWQAEEFVKYDKGKKWYLIAGILLVLVILAAILMKNVLMALTFILIAIIGYVYSKKDPRTIEFKILNNGIDIEGRLYNFDALKSFWIFDKENPEAPYLSLKRAMPFVSPLQLPIGQEDPAVIREKIIKFLPEKKQKQEFSNILEKITRF